MTYPANYSPVVWSPRDAITSTKLQQMTANDAGFQDAIDKAPRGILGRAKIKTNQSSTTNDWNIPGLEVTAAYEANRVIRVSLAWQGLSAWGNPGIWAVEIRSTGTATLTQAYCNLTTQQLLQEGGTLFTTGVATSSGSLTWRAGLKRINVSSDSSSGTIFWLASTDGPSELIVEDIGRSDF